MSNKLSRTLTFHLDEDALLQVYGREAVWLEHLRLTQNEKAAERKVKASQDFGLGFGIEIHQGVAAHQQVNPGDGRISNEVMTTKDHRAAQVLAKGIVAVRAFKVTLSSSAGTLHLLGVAWRA